MRGDSKDLPKLCYILIPFSDPLIVDVQEDLSIQSLQQEYKYIFQLQNIVRIEARISGHKGGKRVWGIFILEIHIPSVGSL